MKYTESLGVRAKEYVLTGEKRRYFKRAARFHFGATSGTEIKQTRGLLCSVYLHPVPNQVTQICACNIAGGAKLLVE